MRIRRASYLDTYTKKGILDPKDDQRNLILADAGRKFMELVELSKFKGEYAATDIERPVRAPSPSLSSTFERVEIYRKNLTNLRTKLHDDDWIVLIGIIIDNKNLETIGRTLDFSLNSATKVVIDRLRHGLDIVARHFGLLR